MIYRPHILKTTIYQVNYLSPELIRYANAFLKCPYFNVFRYHRNFYDTKYYREEGEVPKRTFLTPCIHPYIHSISLVSLNSLCITGGRSIKILDAKHRRYDNCDIMYLLFIDAKDGIGVILEDIRLFG